MATANKSAQQIPWWKRWNITQAFGVHGEQGADYGTPYHTAIESPYGGRVTRAGCFAYGCEADVQTSVPGLGSVIEYVIHLDTLAVQAGQSIGPGALLGLSGGETQQQVNAGLFPGAQHPVQNNAKVTYSTGPHVELGFTNGTPFARGTTYHNPVPYLPANLGTGSAGDCASACNGDPACIAWCDLTGASPATGNPISSLGPDIGAGITSGLQGAGTSLLHTFGFSSAPDAAWRIGLVVVGLFVLFLGFILLFSKQMEEGIGTIGGAAAKAA